MRTCFPYNDYLTRFTITGDQLKRIFGHIMRKENRAGEGEDVFYYLTIYNENYEMPPRPDHVDVADIMRGLYLWSHGPDGLPHRASVLFSGSAQGAARVAASDLAEHYGVSVDLWSATSYKRLRVQALETERWNRLHPGAEPRVPDVTALLSGGEGPVVAVTDFMKLVPEQVARFVPRRFVPLGTDGFGRSDTREALRHFFEVDAGNIVVAVLSALVADGLLGAEVVAEALTRYGIDPDSPDPADPTNMPRTPTLPTATGRRATDTED